MKPEVVLSFDRNKGFNMGTNFEEEVDKLTQEGHQYLADGDLESACSAFDKAASLSSHLKEGFTERACFFNLGACCVARGDAKKGVEYLRKALPPDKESDGTANFADLQYNLGLAYDALNQIELAVDCYKIVKDEYKTQTNEEMQGETLIKLAVDCFALGNLTVAADFYLEAGNVYRSTGDKTNEVLSLNSRASLLGQLHDIDKCAETLKMVVNLCEDLTDTTLKGKIYNDLGLLYNSLQSYDNAAECFEIAIPLVNTAGQDKELEAVLRQNLGAIYNQLGKYKEASEHHESAIKLHGELGNRVAQGQTFCNMGFAHSQLGNFEEAAESFLHAVQASKDGSDKYSHWQALEGLAAVYFLQGNYDRAVENYKCALAILATSGESVVQHNDRIVSKLADAMECQLKVTGSPGKRGSVKRSSRRSTSRGRGKEVLDRGKGKKAHRVGRTRPRQDNHKLIARGIDGGQDDDSDSYYSHSEDRDSDEGDSKDDRYITPTWESKRSEEETLPLGQSGPYQKLVDRNNSTEHDYEEAEGRRHRRSPSNKTADYSSEMPRSHREAYLASIATSNSDAVSTPERSPERKTNQSKTCVIQ